MNIPVTLIFTNVNFFLATFKENASTSIATYADVIKVQFAKYPGKSGCDYNYSS